MVRAALSAKQDHPQRGSRGNSPLASRGAKQNCHIAPTGPWADSTPGIRVPRHLSRDSEGWSTPLSTITEAGSRPLLRQPSPTPQSAAPRHSDLPCHHPPEALPCWTEDFVCPAAHLAPETLPCRTLATPLPTVLSPGPADRDSGARAHYTPLDCQSVSRILMYVDVLL